MITFVQYVRRLLQKIIKITSRREKKDLSSTVMTSIYATIVPNTTLPADKHRSSKEVVESCRLEAET